MSRTDLKGVVDAVQRRAQRQGFVVPREIRAELMEAGLNDSLWKDVLALAGSSLNCRHGRYYYVPAGPSRMRVRVRHDHVHLRHLQRAVRWLIRQQRAVEAVHVERRSHRRMHFVCPVQVETADHRVLNLVSREISVSGIRLLGTMALQGQRVRVWIPRPENSADRCCFLVQMLWSAVVGDGLCESGGVFLELIEAEPNPLKIASQE
ncbi:MAG: hypothetical protein K2R98_22500 [Gemmataceae bacterium]|nr:hypothetical protein [Gemmataceae bacterium]